MSGVLYVVGIAVIGLAAWLGRREPDPVDASMPVVIPTVAAAAAVGVLIIGLTATLTPVSIVLAVAALVAFGGRLAIAR